MRIKPKQFRNDFNIENVGKIRSANSAKAQDLLIPRKMHLRSKTLIGRSNPESRQRARLKKQTFQILVCRMVFESQCKSKKASSLHQVKQFNDSAKWRAVLGLGSISNTCRAVGLFEIWTEDSLENLDRVYFEELIIVLVCSLISEEMALVLWMAACFLLFLCWTPFSRRWQDPQWLPLLARTERMSSVSSITNISGAEVW